jgi:hypothetical protein
VAREKILAAVNRRAVRALLKRDAHLFRNDLSERCIAARLAFHLQSAVPSYRVDVEYNRIGADAKSLGVPERCAKQSRKDGEK